MSIADDLVVLDEWMNDAPNEAGAFAVALDKRYPNKNTEDALLQFAIDAPDKYSALLTSLRARYTKTQSDIEREVGQTVLRKRGLAAARKRLEQAGVGGLSKDERAMLAAEGDLEINLSNPPKEHDWSGEQKQEHNWSGE